MVSFKQFMISLRKYVLIYMYLSSLHFSSNFFSYLLLPTPFHLLRELMHAPGRTDRCSLFMEFTVLFSQRLTYMLSNMPPQVCFHVFQIVATVSWKTTVLKTKLFYLFNMCFLRTYITIPPNKIFKESCPCVYFL